MYQKNVYMNFYGTAQWDYYGVKFFFFFFFLKDKSKYKLLEALVRIKVGKG